MKKLITIFSMLALLSVPSFAQMGIGTTAPDGSAMLDLVSNAKGLLSPRMTTAERVAIVSPAEGLLVYDTDTHSFWFYKSGTWTDFGSGGGLWTRTGTTTWLTNTSDFVGIGTTNPQAELDVAGFIGNLRITTKSASPSDGGELLFLDQTNNEKVRLQSGINPALTFYGRGTIATVGNALRLTADGTTNQMFLGTDGNVGIGTTTPINLIEVAGLIRFDDMNENTALGHAAVTGGTFNTGVGYAAANNTLGSMNTAIGAHALVNNDVGNSNTAVGHYALSGNQSGSHNTAVGVDVMPVSTSGGYNTAIGYSTLMSNTSGYYNTVIGTQAGPDLTTGSNNTFVGTKSGEGNTTGSNNIAIGVEAALPDGTMDDQMVLGDMDLLYGDLLYSRLGIGTTTPLNKLHISATADPLRLEGLQTSTQSDVLVIDANGVVTTNAGIAAGSSLWTRTGSTTWLTNTSDFVGIGTTNPQAELDVSGFIGNLRITTKSASPSDGGELLFLDQTNNEKVRLQSGINPALTFYGRGTIATVGNALRLTADGTTNQMFLGTDGRVGIGTTAPGTLVDIFSTSAYPTLRILSSAIDGGGRIELGDTDVPDYLVISGQNDSGYPGIFSVTSLSVGTTTASPLNFYTDDLTRMRVDEQGDVGIGVLSATNRLHVSGTNPLRLEGLQTSVNTGVLVVDANGVVTTNAGIGTGAGLWTRTGTTTWLTNASDYVGIGTTNPENSFQIRHSSSNTSFSGPGILAADIPLALQNSDATTGNFSMLGFKNWNNQYDAYIGSVHRSNAGDLVFLTRWNVGTIGERMRIDYNGNVGIGNSAPDNRLEVMTTSNFAMNTQITLTNLSTNDYDPLIAFELADGTPTFTMGVDDSDGDKFKIGTTALDVNTRMVIDNNGYVGIGKTNPGAELDVAGFISNIRLSTLSGSPSDGGEILFLDSNGSSEKVRLRSGINPALTFFSRGQVECISYPLRLIADGSDNQIYLATTGRVGVGTTNPQGKMDVYNSGAVATMRISSGGSYGSYLNMGSDTYPDVLTMSGDVSNKVGIWTTDNDMNIGTYKATHLLFLTDFTERMRLSDVGNFGIATTNPTEKLTINGNQLFTNDADRTISVASVNPNSTPGRHLYVRAGGHGSSLGVAGNLYLEGGTSPAPARVGNVILASVTQGKVGVRTNSPNTVCDIAGDISYRQNAFTAANGANNNISIGSYSFIRISGPTLGFSITGVAGGYDGKIVTLYNSGTTNMTIANQSASSTDVNRIITLTGADISTTGTGSVTLQYSTAENRWIVIAVRD